MKTAIFFLLCVIAAGNLNAAFIIDTFDTAQSLSTTPASSPTVTSADGAGILELERDIALYNFDPGTATIDISGGILTYSQDADTRSEVIIIYGGNDDFFSPTDSGRSTSLGPIDLLSEGITDFEIVVDSISSTFDVGFLVRLFDGSSYDYSVVELAASPTQQVINLSLSDYSGVDLSNIQQITFEMDFINSFAGPAVVNVSQFSAIPEPTTTLLFSVAAYLFFLMRINCRTKP